MSYWLHPVLCSYGPRAPSLLTDVLCTLMLAFSRGKFLEGNLQTHREPAFKMLTDIVQLCSKIIILMYAYKVFCPW